MIKKTRKLIKDVLFVSKITNVTGKKRTILFAVLLAQISALTDILIILFFSVLITNDFPNFLIPYESQFEFFKYFIPIVVIFRYLFQYMQGVILKRLELNVALNLKTYFLKEIFDRRNYSVSDAYFYMNTLSGHISFFYSNVASFVNSFLQMSAYLAYLIFTDSRTLLTFSIGLIILFYPIKTLLKKTRRSMHLVYGFTKKLNDEIQRIVENIFLIKLLNKDKDEISNFDVTVNNLNKSELSNFSFGLINSQIPGLVTMFTFSIILVVSNFARSISLDFVGVTLRLFQSFGALTAAFNRIVNSSVHMENFYELEKNKEIVFKDNFVFNNERQNFEIEFKDVAFKYLNSETQLFENLNFKLKKSEHVIITGPNGSGKSTLLGLASGIFYPSSGKVFTNTEKFGYIGPNPLIFTKSLRENILYGNSKNISDEAITYQLKELDLFKEEENYNLEKQISNTTLSSGQMQKLAFVRALLSDIEILLLDESTANLDDISRKKIFKLLQDKNLTIINSTHDPEKFDNVTGRYKIEIEDEKRFLVVDK
tara:strand:+ start:934 stop:2553 length:1620 start_codon:yes stop_codon:yes gene_type:complete